MPAARRLVLDQIAEVQLLPNGRVSARVYADRQGAGASGAAVRFVVVAAGGFKTDGLAGLQPERGTPPS